MTKRLFEQTIRRSLQWAVTVPENAFEFLAS